jgi:hypothetical protein
MNATGRFYERILGWLHKFEFTAYIFKKVGEEHPSVALALAGAWSYLLNLILGNVILTLLVAIPLGSAVVLWRRKATFHRPKRRRRGRRRRRRGRKGPERLPPVEVSETPGRQ